MNDLKSKGFKLLQLLSKYGEAYIVGGAVRDIIMGIEPNDIDIATNVPMDTIEILFPTHDIGKNKDFGIVVVEFEGESIEVAQFRKDGEYTNNRSPESVQLGVSFKDDTSRRDFTINSLGMDKNGIIIDFHCGKYDIENEILKTVGNPVKRFAEDSLRMLRAIRFASRFDLIIDINTFIAIKSNAHNITKVSQERIANELFKMAELDGNKFADAIILLKRSNLLRYILPEVDILDEFEHNKDHHPEGKNVFLHVISALRTNTECNAVLNMSILLHDVGKAKTQTINGEKISYKKHDVVGVDIINDICDRLKLDNNTRDTLVFTCKNHMKIHLLKSMRTSKLIKLISNKNWEMLTKVGYADESCRGEPLFSQNTWDNKMTYISFVIEKYSNPVNRNDLPLDRVVTGKLVMKLRNITEPCKEIGIIINATKRWVYDENIDIEDLKAIENYIVDYQLK